MENELTIRLSAFLVLFLLFALLESYWPRRKRVYSRLSRWPTHWAITAINALMLRALSFGLPLLAVGAALDASQAGLGLFNHLNWPIWAEFTIFPTGGELKIKYLKVVPVNILIISYYSFKLHECLGHKHGS